MQLKETTHILIVGLGLLGGSYAMALSKKGYHVEAITLEPQDIEYGITHNLIESGTTEVEPERIARANLIIFALYPHVFEEWIDRYGNLIQPGTLITDVTGVKGALLDRIQSKLPDQVEFIAAHPMAGREVSGVENSDDRIFREANYIVVPTEKNTPEGIEACKELAALIGCRHISVLEPDKHDEMIAFLSQLAHCIAVSLMCCHDEHKLVDYTGDSFRDLTRIANINDEMWSELFLVNKEHLLKEMDLFAENFSALRNALAGEDREEMRRMMRLSTERRSWFDKKGDN